MQLIVCVALLFTVGRCTSHFSPKVVGAGQDVTLTCRIQASKTGQLFWMKFSPLNIPEIAASAYSYSSSAVFKAPRFTPQKDSETFNLRMQGAVLNDTAYYVCIQVAELEIIILNATFLQVKEPKPAITVSVLHPGTSSSDSLKCSILSDSGSKRCTEKNRVFWFKARQHGSPASLLYTYRSSGNECKQMAEDPSRHSCVYNFLGDVRSSDAGSLHCAVATCGEILLGKGAQGDSDAEDRDQFLKSNMALYLFASILVVSLSINAWLVYTIKKKRGEHNDVTATTADGQQSQLRTEESLVYSEPAPVRRKAGGPGQRAAKKMAGDTIYSGVRVS